MLKNENRLKKIWEFNYVFKHGKTIGSKDLVCHYCKNKKKTPQIGFSISKKIGKANERNLLKRRLREICFSYTEILDNINIVFVAKETAKFATFLDIENQMKIIFKKIMDEKKQ